MACYSFDFGNPPVQLPSGSPRSPRSDPITLDRLLYEDTVSSNETQESKEDPRKKIWITGLATQYPPSLITPQDVSVLAAKYHDIESASFRRFNEIARRTGIETRAAISTDGSDFGSGASIPTISEIDSLFRRKGVELAAQACKKALSEWGGAFGLVTHTVAVTCTSQGNPGYDLLVNNSLGLQPHVQRTLLHGVGCAGGLAIMRTAAQLAHCATAKGEPAVVLAYACELCTPLIRHTLAKVANAEPCDVGIEGTLFSDAAAAFVLCNQQGLSHQKPLFELCDYESRTLPDTVDELQFMPNPWGYDTILTKSVPHHASCLVKDVFDVLLARYEAATEQIGLTAKHFAWALHPGGTAVVNGVQAALDLDPDQLSATREIYRTRGNSSSPTALIVLDRLRDNTIARHIVATSFGPGITIEMSLLVRC